MNGTLRLDKADPLDPAIRPLIEAHLAHSWDATPQTSNHTMTPETIAAEGLQFFALRDGDAVMGCGALKALGDAMVEVKSVHVAQAARGQGHARRIMADLIDAARTQGFARMVLETGADHLPGYDAARGLYQALGFAYCGPIPGYKADPNSAFMTLELGKPDLSRT